MPDATVRDCPYPPTEIHAEKALFEHLWALAYGDPVSGLTDAVLVQCFDAPELYPDGGPAGVRGQTFNATHVGIATRGLDGAGLCLRRTSLRHELAHSLLWQVYGDPDADHTHSAFGDLTRPIPCATFE